MTLTVERPPVKAPDAGVIEEARARQRRHRGVAGAAIIAAAAIASILLAFTGGGGGSHAGHVAVAPAGQPSKTARSSPASCGNGQVLKHPPSRSLLSILGVLRRPATAADNSRGMVAAGLVRDVFVPYIRLTRVIGASSYYIYPAVVGGCGTGQSPREGIMTRDAHIDLGHGMIGADGGGGASAADIEQGRAVESGPPGSSTSETITMVVPDGVAQVTLHYAPGPDNGYTRKISPSFRLTSHVINNELVVLIPRSVGLEGVPGVKMIWRAPSGRIVRTFNRL
jgi:hypothetical protein